MLRLGSAPAIAIRRGVVVAPHLPDPREFAQVPCLSRDTVVKISECFTALNPYSFGGTILKIEDVNYVDGNPRKPFRDLYGSAISAKRYCLFEGKNVRKIVDSKAHGIGYLMNPIPRKETKMRISLPPRSGNAFCRMKESALSG